jgi:hydrogenase-4 component E
MPSLLDQFLVLVLLFNFLNLGTSRIGAVIRTVAIQGVLIGFMPLLVHGGRTPFALLIAAAPIALKGFVIPAMLLRAMRDAEIKREVEPIVGIIPSLVLGALGTGLAVAFSERLPLLPEHADTLLVPASLATVFTGFLMLTTRLKAISQVLGYLTLENGIFVFGLLLAEAMPMLLEFGVLLDLFVCIFVMGIILNHISREFASLSTKRLSALKE